MHLIAYKFLALSDFAELNVLPNCHHPIKQPLHQSRIELRQAATIFFRPLLEMNTVLTSCWTYKSIQLDIRKESLSDAGAYSNEALTDAGPKRAACI